jgi:hypothetical protein
VEGRAQVLEAAGAHRHLVEQDRREDDPHDREEAERGALGRREGGETDRHPEEHGRPRGSRHGDRVRPAQWAFHRRTPRVTNTVMSGSSAMRAEIARLSPPGRCPVGRKHRRARGMWSLVLRVARHWARPLPNGQTIRDCHDTIGTMIGTVNGLTTSLRPNVTSRSPRGAMLGSWGSRRRGTDPNSAVRARLPRRRGPPAAPTRSSCLGRRADPLRRPGRGRPPARRARARPAARRQPGRGARGDAHPPGPGRGALRRSGPELRAARRSPPCQSDALSRLLRLHVALANFPLDDVIEVRDRPRAPQRPTRRAERDAEQLATMRDLLDVMDDPDIDREEFNDLDTAFHVAWPQRPATTPRTRPHRLRSASRCA